MIGIQRCEPFQLYEPSQHPSFIDTTLLHAVRRHVIIIDKIYGEFLIEGNYSNSSVAVRVNFNQTDALKIYMIMIPTTTLVSENDDCAV